MSFSHNEDEENIEKYKNKHKNTITENIIFTIIVSILSLWTFWFLKPFEKYRLGPPIIIMTIFLANYYKPIYWLGLFLLPIIIFIPNKWFRK